MRRLNKPFLLPGFDGFVFWYFIRGWKSCEERRKVGFAARDCIYLRPGFDPLQIPSNFLHF